MQRLVYALALVNACASSETPRQAEATQDEASVTVAVERAREVTEDDSDPSTWWPTCEQYSPPFGSAIDHPWVWSMGWEGDDHPCRFGCSLTPERPIANAPGVTVLLHDETTVEVTATRRDPSWTARLPALPRPIAQVQWTSWCSPEIVVAAHDRRTLRLSALTRASGEVLEQVEIPIAIDGAPDEAFAMQLVCWDGRTSIQALGTSHAWAMDLPSHGRPLRPVPTAVFEAVHAWGPGNAPPIRREQLRTRDRIYNRIDHELFTLDGRGQPLWHRGAIDPWIGCLQGGQLMGLVGCSKCPTPASKVSLAGEYVVLEHRDARSTTDVFDRDGTHVAHVGR